MRRAAAVFAASCLCLAAVAGDPAADIERTLSDFSRALSKANAQELRELTGPGFALLEDGRVYSLDETIESARAALRAGFMTRSPVSIRTEVRGSVAWARYEVTGEFRSKEGRVQLAFIESAVLEHAGGRWRVVQVATLPRKKP